MPKGTREEKMLKIIQISQKFLDLNEETLDYALFSDTMLFLSGAKYAAFNLFDHSGTMFQTMSLSGLSGDMAKAAEALGFPLVGRRWKYDPYKQGRVVGSPMVVYEDLTELTGTVLPQTLVQQFVQWFHVGLVAVIRIVRHQKVLGDFTIMMERHAPIEDPEILELFAAQVGLLISKHEEEKEKEENKNRLGMVMEAIDGAPWVWDVPDNVGHVSPIFAEMLGWTLDELGTMTLEKWREMIHPDDRKSAVEGLLHAIRSGADTYDTEYRMKHKDGHWVWILNRGKVLEWTEEGKALRMFGIHMDITATKKITDALREREESYQILVESSYDIIYRLDLEGRFTFVSNAWTTLLGHTVEEAMGKSFLPYVHPDDLSKVERFYQKVMQTKKREELKECRMLHKDGTWRWFTSTATPIHDGKKTIDGFAGTARDITDVKEATDAMVQKNQILEYFFAINPDLLLIASLDGTIVSTNMAWEAVLGYEPKELSGKAFLDFVHPDDLNETLSALDRLGKQEQVWDFINRYRCADGSYRSLEWRSQPAGGYIYAAARDITEKLEKQQEIEYLSFHDHLMGLYNRRYLDDSLKRLDTPRNLPFAVIVLDVNDLKVLNDQYGHFVGDELLIHVAEALKRTCRSDDIVCRMGGDEFVILLPETDEQDVQKVMERLHSEFSSIQIQGTNATVSAGYGIKTRMEDSMESVLLRADSHMYQQKNHKESF